MQTIVDAIPFLLYIASNREVFCMTLIFLSLLVKFV